MAILFETTDPRGCRVKCTKATWNDHILNQRPFMNGWEDDVKKAIEDPNLGIFQSTFDDERDVYCRRFRNKPRYLRVIVYFDKEKLGTVVTAFPADSGKSGEKLIWPQSQD